MRRFAKICIVKTKLRRKKRSADLIKKFILDYGGVDLRKLIKSYRYKIVRGQRSWRSFKEIQVARLNLLRKLWDRIEGGFCENERERQALIEAKELMEQEQLMKETEAVTGTAAKRVASILMRKKATVGEKFAKRLMEKKNRGTSLRQVHKRMKATLRAASSGSPKKDFRFVPEEIKTPLLQDLLFRKRKKYQDTLSEVIRRLEAKRQQAKKLTVVEFRMMMKSRNADKARLMKARQQKIMQQAKKNVGFLLLSSLQPNEMRDLVLHGRAMDKRQRG